MAAVPDVHLARTLPCLNAALRDAALSAVVAHNAPPEVERLRLDLEQARETIEDMSIEAAGMKERLIHFMSIVFHRDNVQRAREVEFCLEGILMVNLMPWWDRWKDELIAFDGEVQDPWSN